MTPPTITILTPAYNRSDKLGRLYESLCAQTRKDFEWLVVDDGSTDDTREVVTAFAADAPFPIRYRFKENGGKHTAVNVGMREAAGAFCSIIDHDDWYVPEALERFMFHWDSIPNPEAFSEVQGLCLTHVGEPAGGPFPEQVFDSDAFEVFHTYGIRGDRIGMLRTDVLRQFPFPEEFGSVYVEESIVWNRIACRYRMRGVNEVLAYKEYLDTGITSVQSTQHIRLSGPRLLLYEEIVGAGRPLPARTRFRAYANIVRLGLHQGRSLGTQFATVQSKLGWLLALPVGLGLYARDRWRHKKKK